MRRLNTCSQGNTGARRVTRGQHFLPLKLYYYLPAAGSASEAYKKRQPNLDFEEMNIPEGSVLTAVGVAAQLKVAGPKTVNFEGEEVSITKATRMVKGISYFVSPSPHWRYNGRFLNDIYEENIPTSSNGRVKQI